MSVPPKVYITNTLKKYEPVSSGYSLFQDLAKSIEWHIVDSKSPLYGPQKTMIKNQRDHVQYICI